MNWMTVKYIMNLWSISCSSVDYEMAAEILEEGNVNYLEMERNIAYKFSVGMILTGDFRTADDERFFACWRREIVDLHEIEKVRILHYTDFL